LPGRQRSDRRAARLREPQPATRSRFLAMTPTRAGAVAGNDGLRATLSSSLEDAIVGSGETAEPLSEASCGPGPGRHDERRRRQHRAAEVAQPGLATWFETGRIGAGGADAERERIPPILEA